ncbi:hypothetical protein [Mesorhizobium sp. CN2-181]|uniref:hypothetical protein n=1 Tax=Mesorhizobium yinganensis TaxID=3157707 RepID=UPI0032B82606
MLLFIGIGRHEEVPCSLDAATTKSDLGQCSSANRLVHRWMVKDGLCLFEEAHQVLARLPFAAERIAVAEFKS